MALLQIAEPGLSTAPHQHRRAVGIDLGTTNSLVASVLSGEASVLRDGEGHPLLPSVVAYLPPDQGQGALVGRTACARQSSDPHNTVSSVKRFMGRHLSEVAGASDLPYEFVAAPGGIGISTVAGIKTPVEVSAQILDALRQRAEASLGGDLAGAVITVPAYFDDAQRQATKDAARLAGLNVLRLLNEPTAAAVAYGLDNASEGVYAVYDLGGGTFDVSILRLSRGVFEVLATNGDTRLGGDDFDRCVFDWIVRECGADSAAMGAGDAQSLLALARSSKETLSSAQSVRLDVALSDGRAVRTTLTRSIFAELTQDLVARTLKPIRRAMRDAGIDVAATDGVILVGGSTRMPVVRAAVREFFGQEPLTNLDPDEVVAIGAAIQADVLAGNRRTDDWLLLDVCPLSLGLETMGGLVEKIVPRNTTLPTARAQDFTTFKDGQTAMSVHVVQGERDLVSDCRSLARFELRGIPPMVAGAARIRVSFQVDADGLLSVSAREQSTGVEAAVAVKPSFGLDDEQIAHMLKDAYVRADEDMRARAFREAQLEARRLLDATEAALRADGDSLLSPVEREHVAALVHELGESLETLTGREAADLAALESATERLNHGTQDFAGRRMNATVHKALAGQRLEEVGARLAGDAVKRSWTESDSLQERAIP